MKCKFCHLTHLNQNSFQHATIEDYTHQLNIVLKHYENQVKLGIEPLATRTNINFMASGEALANKTILKQYASLYHEFEKQCSLFQLSFRVNISTIFPHTVRDHELRDIFQDKPVCLYYSMYSTSDSFRRTWLPNALPYQHALEKLKRFQEQTKNPLVFHWAIIENENDNLEENIKLAEIIASYKFENARFHMVAYNPPSNASRESSKETKAKIFNILNTIAFPGQNNKQIERIGLDVYASCGQFMNVA